MRLKLISCEIFYREMCAAVARSPRQVDAEFVTKGLHDMGAAPMRERLQEAVDRVEPDRYEAVLMGYALCGNGLAGLTARALPLVVPRAHDCITLFLGSKERYQQYFVDNPGVYFKTTGWIERGDGLQQIGQESIQRKTGIGYTYEELVAKYGEENAQYLYAELGDHTKNYRKFTFIEMGVEPDDRFEQDSRRQAAERGMEFEKVTGDLSMIQRLVDGVWDDKEFQVVEPGWRLVATHDEGIIGVEKAG